MDERRTAHAFLAARLADFFVAAFCHLAECAADFKRVLASLALQQDEHGDLLETLQERIAASLPGVADALDVFSLNPVAFCAQCTRQCALACLAHFGLLKPRQDVCAAARSALKLHALFRQQVCELLAGHGCHFARVRLPGSRPRRLRGRWARVCEARLPGQAYQELLVPRPTQAQAQPRTIQTQAQALSQSQVPQTQPLVPLQQQPQYQQPHPSFLPDPFPRGLRG